MARAALNLPPPFLDRTSPVPLYFQLARVLEEEIVSGRWEPGKRLASEPQLGEHFGISRSVVRQTLERLERDGLVARIKGRGTFVAELAHRTWRLQSSLGFFEEEVWRLGHVVSSRIVRVEEGRLPLWVANALDMEPNSPGITIERLRFVDGKVVLFTVNHLAEEFVSTVRSLKSTDSLYERLAIDHGRRIHGGRRVVEAVPAQHRLAELLEVPEETPLAYIESVSWDEDKKPFDAYQTWLRTDRLRIEIQVNPEVKSGGGLIPTADGTPHAM